MLIKTLVKNRLRKLFVSLHLDFASGPLVRHPLNAPKKHHFQNKTMIKFLFVFTECAFKIIEIQKVWAD